MPSRSLGLVALALSLVACALAQSCLSVTDPVVTSLRTSLPLCEAEFNIIAAQNNLVFVPSNPPSVTYMLQVQGAQGIMRALGHGPAVSTVTKTCLNLAIRFACSLVFRACNNTFQTAVAKIPSSALPLPSAPCRSMCNDLTLTGCDVDIKATMTSIGQAAAIPLLLPNCAQTETDPRIAGQPAFPDDSKPNPIQLWTLQLPVNGSVVTTTVPALCASYPNAFEQSPQTFPCFLPWTSTEAENSQSYCDQRCPSATFPESVYKKEALVAMILGWLGYVLTLVVFVTMMMIPRYRAYPAMLVPMLLVGSHIISFGFIFAAIGGYRWVICENGYTQSGSDNGKCVFNGLTILFGGLLTTYTWCLIAVNSALVIVFQQEELLTSKVTKWASMGLTAGLTAFSCIVALATKSIAYQRGLLFCFLHDETDADSYYKPFTWQYPLFIAPLGICILLSTVCMGLVLWKLFTLRKEGVTGITPEKFIRVGLFLIVFLALYSFIFAFRFVNTVHANEWVTFFKDWAAARINNPTAPYAGAKPSSVLCYGFAWAIACQGLLISITFGSTPDVFFFWCNLRKRGGEEDMDNAYGLLSDKT